MALLCALLWLPGTFSLPPLDRDESRFAQASRQMLESDNFIDIRFGTVPRYKKPVGIYWLQAATTALTGSGDLGHIWTYRLASFLGGLFAAAFTFWIARSLVPRGVAFAAASLLAGTLLLSAESIIATTDAVLLATIICAQGVLLRAYLAARAPECGAFRPGLAWLGWAAIAIGILIKGPVTPAICLATALVLSLLDRDARWLRALRPVRGLALVLLIVLPWVIAIWIKSDGAFFTHSLGNDFASKLASGQESHGAPPGYYLALVSLGLWPATLFLIPAIAFAVQQRRAPVVRFLIVWALTVWIGAEIVPTKLPHYVLPAYPALALLMALWIASALRFKHEKLLLGGAMAQYGLGLLALGAAPIVVVALYAGHVPLWLVAAAAAGVGIGACALLRFHKKDWAGAVACALGGAIVLYGVLTLGAAPRLQQLWVSERATAMVTRHAMPGDFPVVLAGYEEPSLVFRLGTATELAVDGAVAANTAAGGGGFALIEQRQEQSFHRRLAELGAKAIRLDRLTGLNYSRGKKVTLSLYRVAPLPTTIVPPAQ